MVVGRVSLDLTGRRGSRGSQTSSMLSSDKQSEMVDAEFDLDRPLTNGEPLTTLMLRNLPEDPKELTWLP
eukprot:3001644-Amphidinium_carterae.1